MSTLHSVLLKLPAPVLREIMINRQMEVHASLKNADKSRLVYAIEQQLHYADSIVRAILMCNGREMQLLQKIYSQIDRVSLKYSQIYTIVGEDAPREVIHRIVESLQSRGLLLTDEDRIHLPQSVRNKVPIPFSELHSLDKELATYDAITLRRICHNLDLDAGHGTRPECVRAIEAHLLENKGLKNLKRPLNREEIEVLNYIIQLGGAVLPTELASAVLPDQEEDFHRYDWQNRWKQGKEKNAIDTLLARGILHVATRNYGFNLYIIIPGDLMRSIAGETENALWQSEDPVPIRSETRPLRTSDHTTLLQDMVATLAFIASQETSRTNIGYMHKSSLKNLSKTLSISNDRYATFLYALARESRLIENTESNRYVLAEVYSHWLSADRFLQSEALFNYWRQSAVWGEMFSDPLKKYSEYRDQKLIVMLRGAVLTLLQNCSTSEFYTIDSLTDAMMFRCPLVFSQISQYSSALLPSPSAYVRTLVNQSMCWLGLVELGWSSPIPAEAEQKSSSKTTRKAVPIKSELVPDATPADLFRVTPLGAALVSSSDPGKDEESPREKNFIVQANAEVFIPPFLDPEIHFRLLLLTDAPSSAAAGNTVSITKSSLRRVLDLGENVAEILSFLQAHSRTGIPQNVEYLIKEVGGRHGHIKIGSAEMYIQTDNALLMKELQNGRDMKAYKLQSLSDTVAILKGEDMEKLVRDLRKAGYMPVVDLNDTEKPRIFKSVSSPVKKSSTEKKPVQSEAANILLIDRIINWPNMDIGLNVPKTVLELDI